MAYKIFFFHVVLGNLLASSTFGSFAPFSSPAHIFGLGLLRGPTCSFWAPVQVRPRTMETLKSVNLGFLWTAETVKNSGCSLKWHGDYPDCWRWCWGWLWGGGACEWAGKRGALSSIMGLGPSRMVTLPTAGFNNQKQRGGDAWLRGTVFFQQKEGVLSLLWGQACFLPWEDSRTQKY